MHRNRLLVIAAVVVLMLSACAGTAGSHDSDDELTGVALILDEGNGAEVQACFGFVQESLPPQCTGPVVHGWDWAAVDGERTAAGATFGSYDVTGTWDGTALTVTQPATVAGPDPRPHVMARPRVEEPDPASVARAVADDDAPWHRDARVVFMEYGDGPMEVTVVFDDGTVQKASDAEYGEGVVVVSSALRPVDDARDR
jgi:uncharacterized lipoprotein YbaY